MERRSLLGRVADLVAGLGFAKRGGSSSDIAAPASRAACERKRAMFDADSIRALRDELDQMSSESLLDRAHGLHLDGPQMNPELQRLRDTRLREIGQALHSHRHDERTSAVNALKEFCFNEELRRRAGG